MANGRNDLASTVKSFNGTLDSSIIDKIDASSVSTAEEDGIRRRQVRRRKLCGMAEHSHRLGIEQELLARVREESLSERCGIKGDGTTGRARNFDLATRLLEFVIGGGAFLKPQPGLVPGKLRCGRGNDDHLCFGTNE